uniref:BNIP3L n=1 Tax=Steinernema glaseri TaxID=37863 RepID=A0A1I7ZKW8_9BILA
MSFFDNGRHPAMFDAKKRLGNVTERIQDELESVPESWVELAPSRASLCSSIEAVIIDRDSDPGMSKDSRLSPVSVQSPHVEFANLEQVKYRLVKDMLPPGRNADWIWDWSSRPEAPPSKSARHRGAMGSTLTTPPNSPAPELCDYDYSPKVAAKRSFFRFNVILSLVVSNLFTLFVGVSLGFYFCRRATFYKQL